MRTHNDTVELANSLKKHHQTPAAESTSSNSAEDRATPGELPTSVIESETQSGQSSANEDSTVVIKEEGK